MPKRTTRSTEDRRRTPSPIRHDGSDPTPGILERLKADLAAAHEQLAASADERDASNRSQTDLQAINAELQNVNAALAQRVIELGRANADLKNLLESTQVAAVVLDSGLRLRSFTSAATEIFRLTERDVGRPIGKIELHLDYSELEDDARAVRGSLRSMTREASTRTGERTYLIRALPYHSVDDVIAGAVLTFTEINGAARAEAALHASERRFAEAQHLAGIGVWEWNLDTDKTWWSPVVYRLWGMRESAAPPSHEKRPVHPDDRAEYEAAMAKARETGELRAEWRVVRPDGTICWLADSGKLQEDGAGRRILGVTQDVSDRKQTETRLKLLLGELQHRVRNILGVVRSIVTRTVRSSDDIDELAAHLDGRLDSLARTQGVFTRSATGSVDLEEMVRDELLSVAAREDQVAVEGPPIRLYRDAAEIMALALHELTTNAVKYGALSEHGGRLAVRWRVVHAGGHAQLALDWRETGVRALDTRPSRAGFGRELIERGLPYELAAETTLSFERGGVHAQIILPLTERVAHLDELPAETVREPGE